MKNIVGVKFKKEGKIYSFHAADLPLKPNDLVIVSTENGPAVGTVAKEVAVLEVFRRHKQLKPKGIAELNETGLQLAQVIAG